MAGRPYSWCKAACFGGPGEEAPPLPAQVDIEPDLPALQPPECLGQPAVPERGVVRTGDGKQVVRGEGESCSTCSPASSFQLGRYQAGDVEYDFLVVDREAAGRGAHLDRHGRMV